MLSLLLATTLVLTDVNTYDEAEAFCKQIPDNGTVIVNSNGGTLGAFMAVGDCIHKKKANLVILKALSAAGYMVTAAKKSCIYDDSVIGYHSPFLIIDGTTKDMSVREYRYTMIFIGNKMQSWGVDGVTTMRIIYTTLATNSEDMFYLKGDETAQVLQEVYRCEELIKRKEESDIGKEE